MYINYPDIVFHSEVMDAIMGSITFMLIEDNTENDVDLNNSLQAFSLSIVALTDDLGGIVNKSKELDSVVNATFERLNLHKIMDIEATQQNIRYKLKIRDSL